MADYSSRIASLKSEQTRLARRQTELAAQRREEVGKLAERLGLLEAEDDMLVGLFLELNAAMNSNSSRLAQWRDLGRHFRSPKSERHRQQASVASHASSSGKAASA